MTRAASLPTPALALSSRRLVPGPAAAALLMALVAVSWLLLPPYLLLGAVIVSAPFLGEQPSAAEQAQAAQLAMAAFAVAAALPWAGWWLAAAQGWRGLARFWAAAAVLGAGAVAVVGLLAVGSAS